MAVLSFESFHVTLPRSRIRVNGDQDEEVAVPIQETSAWVEQQVAFDAWTLGEGRNTITIVAKDDLQRLESVWRDHAGAEFEPRKLATARRSPVATSCTITTALPV